MTVALTRLMLLYRHNSPIPPPAHDKALLVILPFTALFRNISVLSLNKTGLSYTFQRGWNLKVLSNILLVYFVFLINANNNFVRRT